MKEIQDAEKVCSLLMYEYIEEIPTVRSSSSVASWIVRYSTEALGLPNLTTASGVESAGFPGQREEEIDRLLHMVRTVSGSQEQLLMRQGCRWRWANWN
jgi:hypothetical protein